MISTITNGGKVRFMMYRDAELQDFDQVHNPLDVGCRSQGLFDSG